MITDLHRITAPEIAQAQPPPVQTHGSGMGEWFWIAWIIAIAAIVIAVLVRGGWWRGDRRPPGPPPSDTE